MLKTRLIVCYDLVAETMVHVTSVRNPGPNARGSYGTLQRVRVHVKHIPVRNIWNTGTTSHTGLRRLPCSRRQSSSWPVPTIDSVDREVLDVAAWRLAAGELRSEDLPALATKALVQGVDSPALRQLAGQPAWDVRDSRDLFQQALEELGITVPDREDALWRLVRKTARGIVDGGVRPHDGATWIWRQASKEVEDSGDLRVFIGLASHLDDHPEDRSWGEAEIIAAANDLLGRPKPRVWVLLKAYTPRSPLSRAAFSHNVAIHPQALHIGTELRADLEHWDSEHAALLADWPHSGGFASERDAESFVDRGQRLASRLQAELGLGYHVEYMPEPIRPPGVRLRAED